MNGVINGAYYFPPAAIITNAKSLFRKCTGRMNLNPS